MAWERPAFDSEGADCSLNPAFDIAIPLGASWLRRSSSLVRGCCRRVSAVDIPVVPIVIAASQGSVDWGP